MHRRERINFKLIDEEMRKKLKNLMIIGLILIFAVFVFIACKDPEPPPPRVPPSFQYVSGGYGHSIALDINGNIWTWGAGTERLGHGNTWDGDWIGNNHGYEEDRHQIRPRKITHVFSNDVDLTIVDSPVFSKISAGIFHNMALDIDGNIWTWGEGSGVLGHGNMSIQNRPKMISLVFSSDAADETIKAPEFIAISAGRNHSMALDKEGNIWTWGQIFLGHGNNNELNRPQMIEQEPNKSVSLPLFKSISAGFSHSMALDKEGNIWTWGEGGSGALGLGSNDSQYHPRLIPLVFLNEEGVEVMTAPEFKKISAGNFFNMALDKEGNIWIWGGWEEIDIWGQQIGHGSYVKPLNRPRRIMQFLNDNDVTPLFSSVSASLSHSIALDSEGNIWSWGSNWFSELGHGDFGRIDFPQRITLALTGAGSEIFSVPRFKFVDTGIMYNLALDGYGNIWTWGVNANHQLGHDTLGVLRPRQIMV